jgi:hypothetical protein
MSVPAQPKIYHILHVDRLESVLADGHLWCDAEVQRRSRPGTTIGMSTIKQRRLNQNFLMSRFGLKVGDCVPFYFCPRSIMLFLIHRGNDPELTYRGGQEPIVHLECDLRASVAWAEGAGRQWAFTLSNAGSSYFEDRADLAQLGEINWEAVTTDRWAGIGIDRRSRKASRPSIWWRRVFRGLSWSVSSLLSSNLPASLQSARGKITSALARSPPRVVLLTKRP